MVRVFCEKPATIKFTIRMKHKQIESLLVRWRLQTKNAGKTWDIATAMKKKCVSDGQKSPSSHPSIEGVFSEFFLIFLKVGLNFDPS